MKVYCAIIMVSTGTSASDYGRSKPFSPSPRSCVSSSDVANGYAEHFVDFVKKMRDAFPGHVICAGNVVMTDWRDGQLILSGADLIKVGIGPGSVTTTRVKTGVGYPQLSAIIG